MSATTCMFDGCDRPATKWGLGLMFCDSGAKVFQVYPCIAMIVDGYCSPEHEMKAPGRKREAYAELGIREWYESAEEAEADLLALTVMSS